MIQKKLTKIVPFGIKEKAALYVRVSTRYQIDKDSLPFQRKRLKEYCSFLGIDDFVIFEDDGYFAKNTERPQFQNMMNGVRLGEFSHILVWKVDRISRNLLDFAAMYEELKNYKVTFISMNEQFDTSTAIGEAMLKIILIFAELERNMTSERVMGIMLDRAENGLWNGARMPVGYRWNAEIKFPEPDPEERKTVQFIFNEYERVHSCLKVSRYLNNHQIASKRGGQWTSKLIHDIIRNPFYIGTYRYNMREAGRGPLKPKDEWIVKENNHPGIISKEQFLVCNKIMDKNASTRDTSENRMTRYIHTFAGHLVCGQCGSNMIASKDRARANGYKPSMYRCAKRSRMLNCENSKTINETYIGPFIFNYITNLAYTQKNLKQINSLEKLESKLLNGEEFKNTRLTPESLKRTFSLLMYHQVGTGFYVPDINTFDEIGSSAAEQLSFLKNKKEKYQNAITRLTDLYLYDSTALTKKEFSKKKKELLTELDSIDEEIKELESNDIVSDFSDLEFIKKASAFLIAQQISSKKHIDYLQLVLKLDNETIKDFIDQIIDKIIVDEGRVQKIIFINGFVHEFYYTTPAELPVCKLCGGRIGTTIGCKTRTITYKNKSYKRIKVGDTGDKYEGKEKAICKSCNAHFGRWHHYGCEIEVCPVCGKQFSICEHGINR